MSSTPSAPTGYSKGLAQSGQRSSTQISERVIQANPPAGLKTDRKPAGYGLPCAKCRTYYSADLKACPVCKNGERVSANASRVPAPLSPSEQLPDPAMLEEERERFLREFKAQLFSSQLQIRSASTASHCIREENHQNEPQPAAVCQNCYDQMQERVDVLEAALHMDLKEATQIIYDAVWADSSDSSKTYENAAYALLNELRKRSGVTPTFGLLKPVTD